MIDYGINGAIDLERMEPVVRDNDHQCRLDHLPLVADDGTLW
jgi:hypothetical protein